jgi:hypothetical protein
MDARKKYLDFQVSAPFSRQIKRFEEVGEEREYVRVTCPHCNKAFVEILLSDLPSTRASRCLKHLRKCKAYNGPPPPPASKRRKVGESGEEVERSGEASTPGREAGVAGEQEGAEGEEGGERGRVEESQPPAPVPAPREAEGRVLVERAVRQARSEMLREVAIGMKLQQPLPHTVDELVTRVRASHERHSEERARAAVNKARGRRAKRAAEDLFCDVAKDEECMKHFKKLFHPDKSAKLNQATRSKVEQCMAVLLEAEKEVAHVRTAEPGVEVWAEATRRVRTPNNSF